MSGATAVIGPETQPDALTGAVLNRAYRLSSFLGAGGLGLVYRAERLFDQQSVAIKLLRAEFQCDEQVCIRFLSEVRAAQRVDHPGVVRVFDGQTAEDGTPYIVMEFLAGHVLAAEMRRGRLPAQRAVSIASQVLEALSAAHARGVFHRDLKPDNIFVEPQASHAKTKVLDFGIARVIDAAGGATRQTRTGMLLGSPGYMAPEQVRNIKDADQRSDLWALGVIIYEMLTGDRAFPADNEFVRATSVLYKEVPPIESVAPHFSHWSSFFQVALARNPEQRFQSAASMQDALEQVAGGGSWLPPRPSSTQLLSEPTLAFDGGSASQATEALVSRASDSSTQAFSRDAVFNDAVRNNATKLSTGEAPVQERPIDVQVVNPPRRGVAWPVVLGFVLLALMAGFAVGVWVSS